MIAKSPVSNGIAKHYRRTLARRQIEGLIREQGLWEHRLEGERELSARLGIGRSTLRRALVELEAEGLIQRRQGAGTFVCEQPRRGRMAAPKRVAVIVESHFKKQRTNWHWNTEIIQGIERLAARLGVTCDIFALDAPEEAARLADDGRMLNYDGFIAVSCEDRQLLTRLLDMNRGPVVLVDNFVRDLPVIEVVDGSFAGARSVTLHLIALGHRRIAFLDCYDRNVTNPEKFAGYRTALLERQLEFDPELVACQPTPDDIEGFVEEAVPRLLALPRPPTAIFAFDDLRALSALVVLERRGLRVGRDISLASCGDSAIRRGLCDRLTSTRVYWRKMGQEALRAVVAKHRREEGRTIIVPTRLFIRQSTGRPAGGVLAKACV